MVPFPDNRQDFARTPSGCRVRKSEETAALERVAKMSDREHLGRGVAIASRLRRYETTQSYR